MVPESESASEWSWSTLIINYNQVLVGLQWLTLSNISISFTFYFYLNKTVEHNDLPQTLDKWPETPAGAPAMTSSAAKLKSDYG